MGAAMQKFLNHLIETSPDDTAEVQIIFKPGAGASAGGLLKVDGHDDLYELVTFSAPANKPTNQVSDADMVCVSVFFESDAVQRVMRKKEVDHVIAPKGGIVVPGRA